MHATIYPSRASRMSALPLLFARYIAGQIDETAWQQIMRLLDTGAATEDERAALANFISDALADLGAEGMKMPQPEEIEDVLMIARAA